MVPDAHLTRGDAVLRAEHCPSSQHLCDRLSVSPILQMSKLGRGAHITASRHLTQLGGKACALWRLSLSLFLSDPPLHLLTTQERAVVGITSAPTPLVKQVVWPSPRAVGQEGPVLAKGCRE